MKNNWQGLAVLTVLLMALGGAAHAQTSEGRLSGQVTDSSGGAVPKATVTIENLGTHVQRALETNQSGEYVAPGLEPGVYSITVEAGGFAKEVRERVQLEVANDLKINFRLQPGAVTTVVEVKDEAPLTESSNDTLTGVLSNKAINELPLQGRDFENLLPLHPGVQRTPGGGFHSLISNGNRPDDNNFIIDGANDNDSYYGETVINDTGVLGTPASHLPLDAIQEFATQENPQADFGFKPGVVVNIGLKSGTNALHGTAYYFHRNAAFDARNFFNPVPQPVSALLLHQFGASIGGPIVKDKWFYFANYEGVRHKVGNPGNTFSPVTVPLPTPPGGAGNCNFGTMQGDCGNSIPDALNDLKAGGIPVNPLSMRLLSLFEPNPGFTADPNNPAAINFDFNNVNREDNLVVKSDYHPDLKDAFSVSYIYANSVQTEEDTFPLRPEFLSEATTKPQVFGAEWTYTPNSLWVNQLRFSYNRYWQEINTIDHNNNPITVYGINTGVTDPRLFGLPRISPGSNFNYLGGNSSWPLFTTPTHTENFSDTASYTIGRHTIRFGGEFRNGAVNYLRGNYGRGRVDFRSLEDFLTGTVRRGRILVGDLQRNITQPAFGGFLQDDFRLNSRLTVNLGLRYDLTFPIHESNNLIANYIPGQGIVQVGRGISQLYPSHYKSFSPRLGIAWDVFGNGKTVVRTGGGIIYEQPSIRTFINSSGLNLNPSGIPGVLPGNGTINTFLRIFTDGSQINWSGTGPVFNLSPGADVCNYNPVTGVNNTCVINAVDPHLETPYVANWNLNVQQEITPTALLQVAYVGNRGIELYSNRDINQVNPALDDGSEQFGRPLNTSCAPPQGLGLGGPCFPFISFLQQEGNLSGSIYHALQATFTKRYSHGLYLLAGYTWAHAIDTATSNLAGVPQNSLNYRGDRGNGDNDIRNRFTLALTYDLPSVKAPLQLLEGWQLTTLATLEGGEPYTLADFGNDISLTGELNDRWNLTGPASDIHWSPSKSVPFIDPSTFTTDANGNVTGGDARCLSAAQDQASRNQLATYGCFVSGAAVLTPPAPGTFGNAGRNIFRGPSFKNVDVSLSKSWKLTEALKVQFRGEIFNVLNHPNFDVFTLSTDLSSPGSVGLVNFTPDVGNSNPVIGSGGSRHIQLGLKLIW